MGNKDMDVLRDDIKEDKKEATYSVIAMPSKLLFQQENEEKKNMVINNFLRSLRRENFVFAMMYADDYFLAYNKYVEFLLQKPDTIVRFSVLTDSPDVIFGWSLIERDILHYVFVKGAARNKGIGKSLVPTKINWFTHVTKSGYDIWKNKDPDAKFSPFK